jgi:hypothetical protein
MMRNLVKTFIALLAVLVIAIASNPGPDAHRAKIKEAIAARNQIAALLRLGDLTAFASSYRSVVVASYTMAGDRLLSIGAFGIVYVPDLSR